jgi:hypothetical protein
VNRFIRLDTMWSASEWLAVLAAEARLVWVELLCYVKGHGRDGRVKALHPLVASRMWFVGEESVRQLLIAAEQHGALSTNGQDWIIAKWEQYQGDPTAAERQARFKQKQRQCEVTVDNALPTVSNAEKEKETEKKKETPPSEGQRKKSHLPTLEEAQAYFVERGSTAEQGERYWNFYESKGWKVGKTPMERWKAAASNWIARSKEYANGKPEKSIPLRSAEELEELTG